MKTGHKDYTGTPLHKKLGIKPGAKVLLVAPPPSLGESLGSLPEGVEIVEAEEGPFDVVVMFAKTFPDLEAFGLLAEDLTPAGGLWVAWPKKASKIPSEIDFASIQRVGLDNGLVDNKSCSIDEQWQGLRFVIRLKDRKG